MRDRDLDVINPDMQDSSDDGGVVAVPAGETIEGERVQMQPGDHLTILDIGEAESDECARPRAELELHLMLENIGQRLVGRLLPWLAAQQDLTKYAVDAHGSNQVIMMLVEK